MVYEPQVGDLLAVENENSQIVLGMIYKKYKKGGRTDYYTVEWFDETTSYEYNIGDIDTFRIQFVKWRDSECINLHT
jgi:hypothetical protein